MNQIVSISIFFLLIFTGCSSKQYFEPEDTLELKQKTMDLKVNITDLSQKGATLANNSYISQKGIQTGLKPNYHFLNYSDNTLLSIDNNNSINIKNELIEKTLYFDNNIVSASKKNTLLAFGSIDNSITLYDIESEKILFKEYLKYSSLNNNKIANPLFLEKIVLFPTLDGKIVIVNLENKTVIKTINIDPKSDVNNIIFLEENNNSLVSASSNKLFTLLNGKANIEDLDILQVITKDEFIYVATLDGQIIKYDISLNKIASKKFKFAKIQALAIGEYLYALESQEFLIQLTKDLKDVKVFDFSFEEEEKTIAIENTLYFEDKYIILK